MLLGMFDSRVEASEVAGVTPEQLGRYLAGARGKGGTAKVPFDVLQRLALKKGVSLDWLATGEGQQQLGMDVALVEVPVFDVTASSGPGSFIISEELRGKLAFSRAWLLTLNIPLNNLAVMFNAGNSNAPAINHGDAMLIQRDVERLVGDAFYIVDSGGVLLVKELERRADGSVLLKSRNPEYAPQVVPKADVPSLVVSGQVVWAGGLV